MKNVKNLSDEELVEKVRSENKEFFAEVVRRYEEKLRRYVRYLIREEEDEVVQEVFIKAYINLRGFDSRKGKFSSWIYRIAHNEAINKVKQKKHIRLDIQNWLKEMLPGKENVEESYEKKERKEMVKKCLSKLEFNYRSVLLLYFLEDKSYEEISEILKLPMGTVGVRLRRGKEKLKEVCNNNGEI